jgi:hypothetical protein
MVIVVGALLAFVSVLAFAPSAQAAVAGANLVVNGDAESPVGAEWTPADPSVPDRLLTREPYNSVRLYAPPYPGNLANGASIDGGAYVFFGGITDPVHPHPTPEVTTDTQAITLGAADRASVATGEMRSWLSALVGEANNQADYLDIQAVWYDASDAPVLTQLLRPVMRAELGSPAAALLPREDVQPIPASATHIVITVTSTRVDGTNFNGIFDNLSLRLLTGPPPALRKAFSPAVTSVGVPVTATFTIDNSASPSPKNGWTFLDLLQPNLVIAPSPNAHTTCPNGAVSATAGGRFIQVSGDVATGASCTATVDVVSATAGTYSNGSSDVSTLGLTPVPTPALLDVGATAPVPFSCSTGTVFVSHDQPTQLSTLTSGGTGSTLTSLGPPASVSYDAIAFNSRDGLIFAIDTSNAHLVRIDASGAATELGATTVTGNRLAGAFDDAGDYYVLDATSHKLFRVDVATLAVTPIALTQGGSPSTVGVADFAFVGHSLWGQDGASFYRIDPVTGDVDAFAESFVPASAQLTGAAWTYGNGDLVVRRDDTGTAYRVQISGPDSNAPVITLVASVPGPPAAFADGTSCAGPPVDLGVQTSTAPLVDAGAQVTWTLTVHNHGPGSSSGFWVVDELPAAVTDPQTATPGCSIAGSLLTCVHGALSSGGDAVITVTATAPHTFSTALPNTATVIGDDADPVSANDVSTATPTTPPPPPRLSKRFASPVLASGSSRLTLTIANTPDLLAKTGWSFTDALSSGLAVAPLPDVQTTCPTPVVTAAPGSSAIAVSGDLPAGVASCTVTVSVVAAGPGTYANGAANITLRDRIDPPADPASVVFAGPPVVTIASPLDGAVVVQGASLIAHYACAAAAGVASCVASAPDGSAIDTSIPGTYSFTVTVVDGLGQTATKTVTYTVAPRAAQHAPKSADQLALDCAKSPIVLLDVRRLGDRVRFQGVTTAANAGRSVPIRLTYDGRIAARAKVQPDGRFEAFGALPERSIRATNKARYRAEIDGAFSRRVKLMRRLVIDGIDMRNGKITIHATVSSPLAKHIAKVVVTQRSTCGGSAKVVARATPGRRGRVRATFKRPRGVDSAIYRVSTRVRRSHASHTTFATYSLTRGVNLF